MAPTPTKADELADVVGEHGLDDTAQAAIKAYVQSQIDSGIQDQIKEGVQAGLADFYRTQEAIDGARPNVGARTVEKVPGAGYNPKAVGAQLDGKFEGVTDLLAALRGERLGNRADAQRLGEIRAAFSSTTPSEGGFLVPEEFRAELLSIGLENAVVRTNGARVIPMAQPRISFPTIDSTSNASTVYGGLLGYWTEEGGTLTASSARFGRVSLDANKLTMYTEIPNELLADSAISVSALVDRMFPEGMSYFEDVAFISGSGVGQPLGFLNADCAISVAKETSQAADTILWANLVKMYSRMLPTSLGRAVWIINQDAFPTLAQMTIPVKNVAGTENVGGAPVLVTATDGQGRPNFTILGRPVVFTEKVPTVGDQGDINFVDLTYYLIGDRQQMTAMTSDHFKFNTDTTAYRLITRLDGRPWLQTAMTPRTGANTLSPFVKLDARA
jgi:HK97 family phage major capsid protein